MFASFRNKLSCISYHCFPNLVSNTITTQIFWFCLFRLRIFVSLFIPHTNTTIYLFIVKFFKFLLKQMPSSIKQNCASYNFYQRKQLYILHILTFVKKNNLHILSDEHLLEKEKTSMKNFRLKYLEATCAKMLLLNVS